jgi:hypothetical protein
MNSAAKGCNDMADRWSPGARESNPTIAPRPVMRRPGLHGMYVPVARSGGVFE